MRAVLIALAALGSLGSTAALAQGAAAVKPGVMIVSSDGKRIGRIDRIITSGQEQSASVIYDSRFVYVPVSTLTVGEDGRATTTLSRKEVSALR
jgi:hypothetical protein